MDPTRIIVPKHSLRGTPGDVDFGSANRALFVPFEVEDDRFVVASIEIIVVTQNGNIDVGIYSEGGARLTAAGSTAVGAAGVQSFNVTDVTLTRGRYYLGIVLSGTTAKLRGCEIVFDEASAPSAQFAGVRQEASALPLPAAATFASPSVNVVAFAAIVRG